MTEDQSSIDPRPRSWIDKIAQVFSDEPTDKRSLLELLRNAEQDQVLDADALGIIEGALQVSSMQVRDIMIPRSQVVTVPADLTLSDIVELVTKASHSRFPGVGENVDNVMGILLAKDLLPLLLTDSQERFGIKDLVRPATFVPESKRLNVLLKEFRETRQHMAIVIDEYGSVSGAVTIEDVLEQIVGEIEDEHDVDEGPMLTRRADGTIDVDARLELNEFEESIAAIRTAEEREDGTDTVGGLVFNLAGRVPTRGEVILHEASGVEFEITDADARRVRRVRVCNVPQGDNRPS